MSLSTSTSLVPRHGHDGRRIRANYLRKLGILPSSTPVTCTIHRRLVPADAADCENRVDESNMHDSVITTSSSSHCSKYDESDTETCSSLLSSASSVLEHDDSVSQSQPQQRRRRHVHFHPSVIVVEIPSHRDYDKATRRRLWTSLKSIQHHAERNSLEYRAEGSDWRHAVEESHMICYKGKWIHPATWRFYTSSMQSLPQVQQSQQSELSLLPVGTQQQVRCSPQQTRREQRHVQSGNANNTQRRRRRTRPNHSSKRITTTTRTRKYHPTNADWELQRRLSAPSLTRFADT